MSVVVSPEPPRRASALKAMYWRMRRAVRQRAALAANYLDDWRRYGRASASYAENSDDKLRARITARYHSIEKGLSLPAPRPGFGREKLKLLLDYLDAYGPRANDPTLAAARNALIAYREFHHARDAQNYPFKPRVDAAIATLSVAQDNAPGGAMRVRKAEIEAAIAGVTEDFFLRRHSIRQFSGAPVDRALIERAVRIAQRAPSVCNRQAGFAHVVVEPALKQKALALQGGAAGFAEEIDTLFVVTARLSRFWDAGERNQAYVDGGLFAMSLLLGLHAQGLGAICLNWSKTAAHSDRLRALLGLAEDEVIITMIGAGHLRETFEVACSPRLPVENAYRVIT